MKQVVAKYGINLEKLIQQEGISEAYFNVRKHAHSLHDAFKCLLNEIYVHLVCGCYIHQYEVPGCCVCYPQLNFQHDLFRLGHAYCIECITILVTSPTAVFPVLCAAEECSQTLVIQGITSLCNILCSNLH